MSHSLHPMDYNPPGSSVHGILQATTLEWVAIPFSRGSSWPRDWTQVSCIEEDSLSSEPPGKHCDGSTKKDAQCESCELSFIWGKMRTATRETAPQIILRNCFKEVVGEDQESRYKIWWRQSSMQSDFGEGKVQCNQILVKAKFNAIKRLFYKRFSASHEELLSSWRDSVQRLGSWSQFLKISNHRKTCSASFPGAWSASLLHPELLSGHVEGQQQHQHKVQGKCPWQVPVCSWQWYLWGQERTL